MRICVNKYYSLYIQLFQLDKIFSLAERKYAITAKKIKI